MTIGGLQKFSLADYPNHFACLVFLAGCNWRCPWCKAADFVLPERIAQRPAISQKQVLNFLKQQKGRLEAVVLSGGEPTIHQDLPIFCKCIKRLKYKIKLDTNGSNPEMLEKLINKKLVDYVALDIKSTKEKYPRVIGSAGSLPNYLVANVQKSIDLLKENKVDYEFRTTFSPQLTRDDILKIVHWLRPAKRYRLAACQPLMPTEADDDEALSSHRTLFAIKQAITPFFDECEVC